MNATIAAPRYSVRWRGRCPRTARRRARHNQPGADRETCRLRSTWLALWRIWAACPSGLIDSTARRRRAREGAGDRGRSRSSSTIGTPPSSLPWMTPMTRTRRPPGTPKRSATIRPSLIDVPSTSVSAAKSSAAAGVPAGSVDVVVVLVLVVVVLVVVVVDVVVVLVVDDGAVLVGVELTVVGSTLSPGTKSTRRRTGPMLRSGAGSATSAVDRSVDALHAATAPSTRMVAARSSQWAAWVHLLMIAPSRTVDGTHLPGQGRLDAARSVSWSSSDSSGQTNSCSCVFEPTRPVVPVTMNPATCTVIELVVRPPCALGVDDETLSADRSSTAGRRRSAPPSFPPVAQLRPYA